MGRSLDKAVRLVELIAQGSASLTELAEKSGYPKSTTHRLLTELLEHDFIAQNGHAYRLGIRFLEWGERAKRQLHLPEVAEPHMRALARDTSETAHLGILDGSDIVYLAKVNGARGLQMASYVGLRSPAQTTAMGKILIASLPPREWDSHILEIAPATRHTVTNREAYKKELETVLSQGFALDREENEIGVRCVAAPIIDAAGRTVAAISLSGAALYISEERQLDLVPDVSACARAISQDLGAPRNASQPRGRE